MGRLRPLRRLPAAGSCLVWRLPFPGPLGQWLLNKLENEDDAAVEIFIHMIEIKPRRRWSADRYLDRGFENGLFRTAADDLVVGVHDPNEAALQAEEGVDGTKTPTVASPLAGGS